MTDTLAAISRLDDGLALNSDRELAGVFARHASDPWAAMEIHLDQQAADRCVICGECGDGPECSTCTADWDRAVDRSADL